MIKRLRLERFKSFETAELELGPLTLLVGVNASGKSNLRDAFRFLHGIGRGYSLAEIFGETFRAGEKQWGGIRGGTREAGYLGASTFALEAALQWESPSDISPSRQSNDARYRIEVDLVDGGMGPKVRRETLHCGDNLYFDVPFEAGPSIPAPAIFVPVATPERKPVIPGEKPILGQALDGTIAFQSDLSLFELEQRLGASAAFFGLNLDVYMLLGAMRFLDLAPDAMRAPSIPSTQPLSDRGENLAAVLHALSADPQRKAELLEWLRSLTPMDVVDLQFPVDVTGRVLLSLLERDGSTTSSFSASDGTLRFLGVLAALLGPRPPRFVFLEEIENGLHPARLRLLIDLLESTARAGRTQIVATTHSPQVLSLVAEETLRGAILTYRLEGERGTRVRRLWDLPDAPRILTTHSRGQLLASGWFEDVVEFSAAPDAAKDEEPSR